MLSSTSALVVFPLFPETDVDRVLEAIHTITPAYSFCCQANDVICLGYDTANDDVAYVVRWLEDAADIAPRVVPHGPRTVRLQLQARSGDSLPVTDGDVAEFVRERCFVELRAGALLSGPVFVSEAEALLLGTLNTVGSPIAVVPA